MAATLRNSLRLVRIAWVLARNDALFLLEKIALPPIFTGFCRLLAARRFRDLRPGQRLANALQQLGPTFIKLGQSFSTRSDIVGEEIAADLANLQDRLPPFPTARVHAILREEFGLGAQELFAHFEEVPVAAASIAQVHFARLQDGRDAAVKVLRPDVEAAFARDIELFFWLAALVERRLARFRRFRLVEAVAIFRDTVKMELDLRMEAAASAELRQNTAGDEGFYVPQGFWNFTSQRVLTMERIVGTPLGQLDVLDAKGFDRIALVQRAAEAFFNQVYRDGFFHADLHPGNMFVLDNGDLAVVDFGIMGRVSLKERMYLAEILKGFLTEDFRRVAEMHFRAGYVPADKSLDNFTLACRAIAEPILGKPLNEISVAKLLSQLFKVAENFEMETQPQLLLLQKTMMMAEGVGRMLNPDINMWKLAEPLVIDWVGRNMGPAAQARMLKAKASEIFNRLPDLLERSDRWLARLEEGGVPLHPETVAHVTAQRERHHRQWLGFAWFTLGLVTAAGCWLAF